MSGPDAMNEFRTAGFEGEPDDPGILDDQPDMFDANALPEPPHPIN